MLYRFKKTQTQQLNKLADGYDNIAEKAEKNADRADKISEKQKELAKDERKQIVERAKLESRIAELRLKAKDEANNTDSERLAFLNEARELTDKIFAEEERIAAKRFFIKKNENQQSKSGIEDKKEEAELEAALIRVQKQRADGQRRIQTEITTAQNKVNTQKKKEITDTQKGLDANIEAEFKLTIAKKEAAAEQIEDATEKAFALTEIEKDKLAKQLEDETLLKADIELLEFESGENIKKIRENAAVSIKKTSDGIAANNEKNAKKEIDRQKQVSNSKMNLINSAFELAKVIGAKDEKVQKALAIAQVIKNTAVGISKAFTLPPPASYIQATAVGASGAAGILNITNSSSGGGGSTPTVPSDNTGGNNEITADTSGADNALTQQQALENAISNLGLTVSVTEINEAQSNVELSEVNSSIGG